VVLNSSSQKAKATGIMAQGEDKLCHPENY